MHWVIAWPPPDLDHSSGIAHRQMLANPSAVIDEKLRVNGIDGLRVADCLVMPALASGNTNASTMTIAERAADFILSE